MWWEEESTVERRIGFRKQIKNSPLSDKLILEDLTEESSLLERIECLENKIKFLENQIHKLNQ